MPNPTPPAVTPTTPPAHPATVDNAAVVEAFKQASSVGTSPNYNYLTDASIVAKPMASAHDIFFQLKPKNPNVIFRGIAAGVATKDGPSYRRYDEAKLQGYRNVTVNDVKGTVPDSMVRDGGQRIVSGDLVLMMYDRAAYLGALKDKDLKAIRATKRAGAVEDINSQIVKAMQETNMPSRLGRKLQPFIPSEKDFSGE